MQLRNLQLYRPLHFLQGPDLHLFVRKSLDCMVQHGWSKVGSPRMVGMTDMKPVAPSIIVSPFVCNGTAPKVTGLSLLHVQRWRLRRMLRPTPRLPHRTSSGARRKLCHRIGAPSKHSLAKLRRVSQSPAVTMYPSDPCLYL
jgi:hypothetical protein